MSEKNMWTDQILDRFVILASTGISAAQIADQLNIDFPHSLRIFKKNSVIGASHRYLIPLLKVPAGPPIKKVGAEPKRKLRVPAPAPAPAPAPPPPPPPFLKPQAISTPSVSLFELKQRSCRWPMGDPDDGELKFCGCDRIKGSSYCEYHSAISRKPPPKRKGGIFPCRRK